jgi:hypothetical protein
MSATDEHHDPLQGTRRDLLLASAAALLAGGIAPVIDPSAARAQEEGAISPRYADLVRQLATDSGVPEDGVVKVLLELGIGDAEEAIKCAGDSGKVDIRRRVTLEQARFSLRAAVTVVTM